MAKNAIKGITVEIGGDTVGLQKALADVNKKSNQLNSELREVERGLKLDPTNTTLLAQKQQILAEQVKATSDKLQTLKDVQSQVEQQYKSGDIGADAYRAFQREVMSTEGKLSSLKSEQDKLNGTTEETANSTEDLAKEQNKLNDTTEETTDSTEDLAENQNELNKAAGNTAESTEELVTEEKDLEKQSDKTKESTASFEKTLTLLKNSAAAVGSAMTTVAKSVGAVMAATATGVFAAGKAATNVGMEFESSISQLAATMGTSVDNISGLSEKAKEMGSTTQFSATQAADGLNILAMSGLSAKEQMVSIDKVLNLAAAGSLSLESAASYATGAVKGFGDEMGNMQYYTDLMAKGATLANTNVEGLGQALSASSATASSYKQEADSVTLSLLRLAEQNITGEAAATSLNRAMADLYTPTDVAKQALDELGISAYDSKGNTRDFNVVVDELNDKLKDMTAEEANAYKAAIFTTNGLNAFNKMTAASTEKVEEFRKGLAAASEGEGSAAEQAKTMIDNLQGDVTLLQSAAEGLGVEFYETFNDDLRSGVQFATDSLGELTEAFKTGGLEGAADVAGGIIADIANKAAEYAPKLIDTASTLIDSVASALSENSESIAFSAGKLVISIADGLTSNTETILNAVLSIGDNILNDLPDILGDLISSASTFAKSIIDFISRGISIVTKNLPSIMEALSIGLMGELPVITQAIFDLITNTVSSVLPILPDVLSEVIDLATELVMYFLPQIIDTVVTIAESIVENLPKIIDTLVNAVPDIIRSILIAVLNQIPKLLEGVFELVSAITEALPEIISSLAQMLPEIINGIVVAITVFIPKIVETGITLFTALIQDLPTIINSIVEKLPEIIDSIIGALLDALPLLIDCGVDLFLALIENLPTIIMEIQECIPQIIEGVVKALIELFPRIVTVGMQLFMSLVEKLPDVITKLANRMPEIVTGLTNKLKEHIYKMVDIGKNLVEGIWGGIKNAKDWLIDNIFSWCNTVTDSIKDFFGIHSPSTLFRDDIGNNLALGIGEGFADTMSDVSRDMQESIPTAFDINPNLNLVSGDSRMQTLSSNQISSGANTQTIQSNPVINLTLHIDNFNNSYETAVEDMAETMMNKIFDYVRRNKLAVR